MVQALGSQPLHRRASISELRGVRRAEGHRLADAAVALSGARQEAEAHQALSFGDRVGQAKAYCAVQAPLAGEIIADE